MLYQQVMLAWLKFWSGLSSRLLLLLLVWIGLVSLTACSGMAPLSLLTGGGPNVAANTQLGQENNQTLGVSNTTSTTVKDVEGPVQVSNDKNEVKTDSGSVTVNKTEVDPLLILLLILGWVLPSPQELVRSFLSLFKRKQ